MQDTDAFAPLRAALEARGDGVFLERADGATGGAHMLAAVDALALERAKLPTPPQAGDVVALHGEHVAMQLLLPLTAWSLGCCTQLLGARETRSSVEGLLQGSGASWVLAWREPGTFGGWPLEPARPTRLAAGTLLASSGSGGKPKLVYHRLERHVEAARAASAFLGLGAEDRILLSLPMSHVGGLSLLLRAIVSGAALCIPPRGMPPAEALGRFRPTRVSLVAVQLARLLRDPGALAALRACRTVLLGGGPCAAPLRAAALEAGVPLAVGYGATETAAFVAASRDPAVVRRENAAGGALPGRELRISDEGEILVRSPTLLDGLLEDGRLVSPLSADGWWSSGDLGRLEEGVLHVEGRRDRMFVSGGENVQPEEIEAALLGLPGVEEAVVVAVPHEEYGARPVAFVAGADLDAARLDAALRDLLPGFKAPDRYYRLDAAGEGRLKRDLRALAARAADPLSAASLERL